MKVRRLPVIGVILCVAAAAFAFWRSKPTRRPDQPIERASVANKELEELRPLAESVARLLETGDIDAFETATLASIDDWNAVVPKESAAGDGNENRVKASKRNLRASAKTLLNQAKRAGIAPGAFTFAVRSVKGPVGMRSTFDVGGRRVEVPLVGAATIVLKAMPTDPSRGNAGDYEFVAARVQQFPASWRIEAVRLAALPAGVGDPSLRRDLALAAKIGSPYDFKPRPLLVSDDERLKDFGVLVAQLARDHEVEKFVQAATMTRDESRRFVIDGEWGTTAEADQVWQEIQGRLRTSAEALLKQLAVLGADFSDARVAVRNVTVQGTDFRDFGSLDGIGADKVLIELAVESNRNGANGSSIGGNYLVEVDDLMRLNDRWAFLGRQLRWRELPSRLVSSEVKSKLDFENYIAEHGTLPVGMTAPEIEMVSLADSARTKLSSFRGKVVVLDFWATDCGACQSGLAALQKISAAHPEWKGQAEVITVSIDADQAAAQAHLEKRGWTRTNNQWAGAGGWGAAAAKAFRVGAIPTQYVLARNGKIAAADNFHADETLVKIITDELKR
jgi:thiol-disulfide isomerase/thioredoxin